MSTQVDINNIVNGIVNEYTGQTIAYHDTYPGECTVPVAYYAEKLTGQSPVPSMANNRADGWGVDFPSSFIPFFTPETYQPGKVYPKGTLLLWNSPHAAIVLSSDGSNTVEVFEQNADPDGSACHTASRAVNNSFHTCTYALIPIVAPELPYTMAPITHKPMHLNKDAWRYDLTQPTIQAITDNHEGISPAGTNFTAEAIATHIDGYTYVMPNTTDISGYLESDCTNGVWTPPLPVVPQPQLIGAVPATTAPNANDKIVLKKTLLGYTSPPKALSSTPPVKDTYEAGTYFVFSRSNGMANITRTLGQPGWWINPTKNVVPPVITPKDPVADTTWKGTYRAYAEPQTFYFLKNYKIFDVSGQTSKVCNVARGKKITVYGEFIKNNVEYYRLKVEGDTEFMYWYAVPILDQILGTHIIETESEAEKTDATFTYPQKVTPLDKIYLVGKTAEKWLDGIKKKI